MPKPTHLYKYCTARVAKLILRTGCLRTSSPTVFNDPFDCYFPPRFSNLQAARRKLADRFQAILDGRELLPPGSKAAFNYAPLIALSASVPRPVHARVMASLIRNAVTIAKQYDRDSQADWARACRECACCVYAQMEVIRFFGLTTRRIIKAWHLSLMPNTPPLTKRLR